MSTARFRDDFGSTERQTTPAPSQSIGAYHIYNVSARSGQWTNRYNRSVIARRTANTVGFNSTPTLGYNQAGGFAGDIAEVIITIESCLLPSGRASSVISIRSIVSNCGPSPRSTIWIATAWPTIAEIANGLDPNVDDAAADLDGDGFSNIAEYRQGSSPALFTAPAFHSTGRTPGYLAMTLMKISSMKLPLIPGARLPS